MMAQARGDRDVPSEPLGDFYWSMRQVTNASNFARDAGGFPKGEQALFPFWSGVG